MPNRIIRDWTDSYIINHISFQAEVFFTRLIMKADDYGKYYGDPRLLKSNLFPLKDTVRDSDISRWLTECEKVGLLLIYQNVGKQFVRINNFNQRLRTMTSKFPDPAAKCPSNDSNPPTYDSNPPPEVEVEGETEEEGEALARTPNDEIDFKKFKEWISKNASTVSKMKEPFTIDQMVSIKKKFDSIFIFNLLTKMHNYKPLLQKNNSAYLTFLNWANNRDKK